MSKIIIILFIVVISPCFANGAVSLPWSNTYGGTCQPLDNNEGVDCNGMSDGLGAPTDQGNYELITSAANNPSGGGGMGQRHWLGDPRVPDESGNNSGGLNVNFSVPQTELWIRWYMRFESGFKWLASDGYLPQYFKIILTSSADGEKRQIKLDTGDEVGIGGGTTPTPVSNGDKGWTHINGNTGVDSVGDGEFHYYEVHIITETGTNNGTFEFWVEDSDGDVSRVILDESADFLSSTSDAGITVLGFGSNTESPDNGDDGYVDYDDIFISTTGYIGPLGTSSTKIRGNYR